jgi:hypothetical protein
MYVSDMSPPGILRILPLQKCDKLFVMPLFIINMQQTQTFVESTKGVILNERTQLICFAQS